jgi:Zn-dependent protease with chaperone function
VANVMAMLAGQAPVIGALVNSTAGLALNAWSRRSEISADRAGLLCCGSLETAQAALMKIELGFLRADCTSVEDYVASSRQFRSEGIIRRLGEYNRDHPLTAQRIEALKLFMESSLIYRVAGKQPPADAIHDRTLERRVEALLKVA